MKQTKAIHQALKRLIRARGRTYADAAGVLELSEASIKRLFSTATLSLQRHFAERILPDFPGHGFQGSGEQLRFPGGAVVDVSPQEPAR